MKITTVEALAALCKSPIQIIATNAIGGKALMASLSAMLGSALHGEGNYKATVNEDNVTSITGKTVPTKVKAARSINEEVRVVNPNRVYGEAITSIYIDMVSSTIKRGGGNVYSLRGSIQQGSDRKPLHLTVGA